MQSFCLDRKKVSRVVAFLLIAMLAVVSQGADVSAQQTNDRSVTPQNSASQPSAPSQAVPSANLQTAPQTGPNSNVAPTRSVSVGLRELSPWSMFMSASPLVQAIMCSLFFASLVTWTISIAKFFELFIARRRVLTALSLTDKARTLSDALKELASDKGIMRTFVATAINEARLSTDIDNEAGIKERVASSFAEITRSEARRIHFGMGALATIGATAPFVGLFGTVWGIMNSFIGISKTNTTNLAVVAPGIAEALLATATGLVAAIPAVIIYNAFAREIAGYRLLLGDASAEILRHLSRDLDKEALSKQDWPVTALRRPAE